MLITLGLLGIFLGSAAALGLMLARKVPLLLAVPEQLIHESFVTKPSRIHDIVLLLRSLATRQRYEGAVILFLEKTLRRIRVLILRSDKAVSTLISKLQSRSQAISLRRKSGYWQDLKTWKQVQKDTSIHTILIEAPPAGPPRQNLDGIRKIFTRKQEAIPNDATKTEGR